MTTPTVEEDGDEVFTPISMGCQQWKCVRDAGGKIVPLVKLDNGFWTCPNCKGSYGS